VRQPRTPKPRALWVVAEPMHVYDEYLRFDSPTWRDAARYHAWYQAIPNS